MCSHQGEMTTCAFVRACNWAGRKNSSNKPANKSTGGPCSPNSTGAPTPMKSFGRKPKSRTPRGSTATQRMANEHVHPSQCPLQFRECEHEVSQQDGIRRF